MPASAAAPLQPLLPLTSRVCSAVRAELAIEAGCEGDVELKEPDPDGQYSDDEKIKCVVLTEPTELGMVTGALQEGGFECNGRLVNASAKGLQTFARLCHVSFSSCLIHRAAAAPVEAAAAAALHPPLRTARSNPAISLCHVASPLQIPMTTVSISFHLLPPDPRLLTSPPPALEISPLIPPSRPSQIPMTTVEISEEDEELNFKLFDRLDELDDVDLVEHNIAL